MDKNEQTPGAINKPFTRNTKKIKFGDELEGESLAERLEFDINDQPKKISEPDYEGDGEEPAKVFSLGPYKAEGTSVNKNSIVIASSDKLKLFMNAFNNLISNYSEQTNSTSEPNLLALAQNIIKFYSYAVNIDITEGYIINNNESNGDEITKRYILNNNEDNSGENNDKSNSDEDDNPTPRKSPSHFKVLPNPAMWRHLKYCAQSWVEFYHYKFESDRKKLLAETQNNSNTDALAQETLQKLIEKDTELSQPNESCEYNPNYKAAEYLKDINDIVQALDDSPSIMSDLIKNKKNELYAKIIFHTLERVPVRPSFYFRGRVREQVKKQWIEKKLKEVVGPEENERQWLTEQWAKEKFSDEWIEEQAARDKSIKRGANGQIDNILTLLTDTPNYSQGDDIESQSLLRDFALSAKHSPCFSIGTLLPFLNVLHDTYTGIYNDSYRRIYKCLPSTEGEHSAERRQTNYAGLHKHLELEKLLSPLDQLNECISRLEGSENVLVEKTREFLTLINKMREDARPPLSTEDQVTQQAQISTQIDCPDAMSLQSSNDRGL